ncbi:MAG: hypothetical protein JO185_09580, partial [Acidobacteriaceae bacterium]|nr:hypothetical protein [Acidobacteriaceae bacterium]
MMRRRVPVVLQMSTVECGAACLAMILGYFGRKTPLQECRAECDPGRNGVTAQTLMRAARRFGLTARAVAPQISEVESIVVPCIVYWNWDHFVVLERWTRSGAEIVDPVEGRRTVPQHEFHKRFSGVALQFEPGPDFRARAHYRPNPLRAYLVGMLRLAGVGSMLVRILGASLVLQALGFTMPWLTKVLVDQVLPQAQYSTMNYLLLGGFTAAFMQSVVSFVRARLLVNLETKLDGHLMTAFFHHLLKLPFR